MDKICPKCLHQNSPGSVTCSACEINFAQVQTCKSCHATLFDFANFCYSCGLALKPIPSRTENTIAFNPSCSLESKPVGLEQEDEMVTTFQPNGVRLLHCPSSTFFDLPLLAQIITIGKRSEAFIPDLDLRDLPQSEFISRMHVQITCQDQHYYLKDLGSTNGTAINGVSLASGQSQQLAFGDCLRLGNVDAFVFVFTKDQPINLSHLNIISGEDRGFEVELLQSYLESVNGLLETLKPILASSDCLAIKPVAQQIAIASYNVGADAMQLLAKQLEDQALCQSATACKKTLQVLQEELAQVHQFMTVVYGA